MKHYYRYCVECTSNRVKLMYFDGDDYLYKCKQCGSLTWSHSPIKKAPFMKRVRDWFKFQL